MKSKNLLKLIVGVTLVTVLAIALPLAGGCAPKPAAPEPTPTPEPTPEPEEPEAEFLTETWRVQCTFGPAQITDFVRPWLDNLTVALGGRVEFEAYSGGQLVADDQMIRSIQEGTIDLAMPPALGVAAPIDVVMIDGGSLGTWNSGMELMTLYEERGLKELFAESWETIENIKYLGTVPSDPNHLATTRPVETYEDIKGLKIISFANLADPFIEAGASSVTVPPEEFYLSGQTGVVDGLLWGGAKELSSNSWHEVYPYFMTQAVSGAWSCAWIINKEKYNSLPSDMQQILENAIRELAYITLTYYYEGEPVSRKFFTLVTMDDNGWAKIEESIMGKWDEMAAQGPRAAEAMQIIREYQADMKAAKWFR